MMIIYEAVLITVLVSKMLTRRIAIVMVKGMHVMCVREQHHKTMVLLVRRQQMYADRLQRVRSSVMGAVLLLRLLP